MLYCMIALTNLPAALIGRSRVTYRTPLLVYICSVLSHMLSWHDRNITDVVSVAVGSMAQAMLSRSGFVPKSVMRSFSHAHLVGPREPDPTGEGEATVCDIPPPCSVYAQLYIVDLSADVTRHPLVHMRWFSSSIARGLLTPVPFPRSPPRNSWEARLLGSL